MSSEAKRLRILLGDHPGTKALKSGEVASSRVAFDFADYTPTNKGFKPMVRQQAFDVSEMALVTYLMARDHGKPMVLLPATVMGRFAHASALYNAERGRLTVADLASKRVGIRSFTTTSGAWLRGILANDHGVDLDGIEWITYEDPHVAEYRDTTTRAPAGKTILQMLIDGEIDVALGETSSDPRLKPLFADPDAEARAWYAKHGVIPINHVVVVSQALNDGDPETVREVYRLLKEAKAHAPATTPDTTPFGLAAMRPALELIIAYAAQQKLISRGFAVEELFSDLTRGLA